MIHYQNTENITAIQRQNIEDAWVRSWHKLSELNGVILLLGSFIHLLAVAISTELFLSAYFMMRKDV